MINDYPDEIQTLIDENVVTVKIDYAVQVDGEASIEDAVVILRGGEETREDSLDEIPFEFFRERFDEFMAQFIPEWLDDRTEEADAAHGGIDTDGLNSCAGTWTFDVTSRQQTIDHRKYTFSNVPIAFTVNSQGTKVQPMYGAAAAPAGIVI